MCITVNEMEGSVEDLPVRAPRNAILAVGIVNILTRAQPEVHSTSGVHRENHARIDSHAILSNVQYRSQRDNCKREREEKEEQKEEKLY